MVKSQSSGGHLPDARVATAPDVVDEDVEAPVAVDGARRSAGRPGPSSVTSPTRPTAWPPGRVDLRHRAIEGGGRRCPPGPASCAFLGEAQRDGPPEPVSGSRHDGHLILHAAHSVLLACDGSSRRLPADPTAHYEHRGGRAQGARGFGILAAETRHPNSIARLEGVDGHVSVGQSRAGLASLASSIGNGHGLDFDQKVWMG